MSKKSCPVALQVEMLTVMLAPSDPCKPTLNVTTELVSTTVLCNPVTLLDVLISFPAASVIAIVPNPDLCVYPVMMCVLPSHTNIMSPEFNLSICACDVIVTMAMTSSPAVLPIVVPPAPACVVNCALVLSTTSLI